MKSLRELNIEITKKDVAKSVTSDLILIQSVHAIDETDMCVRRLSVALKEWYSYYNPYVLKISDPEELLFEVRRCVKGDMGGEFSEYDLDICRKFSFQIDNLLKLRNDIYSYIKNMMGDVCPNVLSVCGVYVGAKLLSLAGSLKSLASMRAPTIQVLGAEKALFKHIKKGSRPPKFGIIFMHPSISSSKEKAKSARKLASEIAIAARRDYFRK